VNPLGKSFAKKPETNPEHQSEIATRDGILPSKLDFAAVSATCFYPAAFAQISTAIERRLAINVRARRPEDVRAFESIGGGR
jgi:hypothetical protein